MKPEVIYAGSPPGGDSIYGHWPWLKGGGRRGPWNLCFWYQKLLETSLKSIEMFKPLSLERLGHKMSILNVVAKTVLVLFLLSQKNRGIAAVQSSVLNLLSSHLGNPGHRGRRSLSVRQPCINDLLWSPCLGI